MNHLAIDGGVPVRKSLLPYGQQWIEDDDITTVIEVLKTNWITQGPKVEDFEEKFAEYCGAKYAVAFSSGTSALHASCFVAKISAKDEAITTPITFAATANSILYCNARPVFADIKSDTLNIDPEEIKKRLSPKSKVILPVDFAGHPSDIDEIKAIAKEKGLIVIEDAAHALGAEYKGHKIGSLSDMTIFSFHPVKHITTGEGGMVTTNSKYFSEELRLFRQHGIVKDEAKLNKHDGPWYYEMQSLGYNYRITDFQCALGLTQMEKLDIFVERRREIAAKYNESFNGMAEITTPVEKDFVKGTYHIYTIQLASYRKEIFNALRAENIGVNVHYIPVHLHPYYKKELGFKEGDYPKAENYYKKTITLPIFPKMTDKDAEDVINAVHKVVDHYRK